MNFDALRAALLANAEPRFSEHEAMLFVAALKIASEPAPAITTEPAPAAPVVTTTTEPAPAAPVQEQPAP